MSVQTDRVNQDAFTDQAQQLIAATTAAGSQPLDSDLTAIAALTTTSFGRSLLTQASAASLLSTLGAQATLSGAALTAVTVAADDKVLIQDTSDSNNLKTVTTQSIADLASGGVTDGDKGDIVVSSAGTVWTFDSGVVTAAGRAILDDADNTAQRATLGLGTMATQDASAVSITGGTATFNNGGGLRIEDAGLDHVMQMDVGEDFTSSRFLTFVLNDGDRTLTVSGNANVSGTNSGDQTSIVGVAGTMTQFNTALSDGNFIFENEEAISFTLENRTSDPVTPNVGQIWLRVDL